MVQVRTAHLIPDLRFAAAAAAAVAAVVAVAVVVAAAVVVIVVGFLIQYLYFNSKDMTIVNTILY